MMRTLFLALSMFITSSSIAMAKTSLNPERTIIIDGPITGKIVKPVVETMNKLAADKSKPIDIIISSPGGSVVAGYIIVDTIEALRAEGVKFRCGVRSLAASMAFQMLLHCDERYSTPHAFLLWHPVRVFYMGVLTADAAKVAAIQMGLSDKMVLGELHKALPLEEKVIDWHFTNETLHHASQLDKLAPGFFKQVSSGIGNLFTTEGVALNTADLTDFSFSLGDILYIHETFMNLRGDK
jgi:ATP-dependent protease ClpP protease subunit